MSMASADMRLPRRAVEARPSILMPITKRMAAAMYASASLMKSSSRQLLGHCDDLVEHLRREPAGVRVLQAHVVGVHHGQRPRLRGSRQLIEPVHGAMRERVGGQRGDEPALAPQLDHGIVADLPYSQHRSDARQQGDVVRQPRAAVVQLLRGGPVTRRRAASGGGYPGTPKLETIP